MMSDDGHRGNEVCDETLAQLLEAGGGELLTDLLVSALRDAHRFLADEVPTETRH